MCQKRVNPKLLVRSLILVFALGFPGWADSGIVEDLQKAQFAHDKSQFNKAIYFYKKILADQPDNIAAQYGMAEILYRQQKFQKSLQVLDDILQKVEFEGALALRARIYGRNQNWGKAVDDAERLIRLNPLNEQAYILLENAYSALGDEVSAKQAMARYELVKTQ